MDLTLSQAARRIIDAVIDAPVAWRTPGELANRLGWSLDETLDEIADLDAAGWLEAWELVDGPVVTLSVAGSGRFGVRLVEFGFEDTPRWARPGEPDPPTRRAPGVFRDDRAARLALVADSRPTVEQVAILREEAEAHHAATASGQTSSTRDWFPRPTLFVGEGLSPWPGPGEPLGANCPACCSARLPAQAYCLWCDRWGLDGERTTTSESASRIRSSRHDKWDLAPEIAKNQRERDREKRKQRRKERRWVQERSRHSRAASQVPCQSRPRVG